MVSDLNFESHPGKLLEQHLRGVLQGTLLRSSSVVSKKAALFHDFGKINPNFQSKLHGMSVGYSNHSNLSVIAFVNFAWANIERIKNECNLNTNDEFALFVFKVSIIIANHHQHLPDFESAFSSSEDFVYAKKFAKEYNEKLPISKFLNYIESKQYSSFNTIFNEKKKAILLYGKIQKNEWLKNPLFHFMDTQSSFAAIIESDKRDAADNKIFSFNEMIDKNVKQLDSSLVRVFDKFDGKTEISDLNILRTRIRKEAIEGVKIELKADAHVFTLSAPTGSGKTFTLLSIANEIRKQKGGLGIIYSLPFLSITDQVQEIASDLMEDILSVNSKSENERIDNAQKAYDTDQSIENLSNVLKEDFIQNTFDHPFIITTFVQFFETLLSNKNSVLLKLPNFSNRIFLIDEVQALPPRLYIFFTAYLNAFCKRNNSYAVLSTATMPNMEMPQKKYLDDVKNAKLLFSDYSVPNDLIDANTYFKEEVFNRYSIEIIKEDISNNELASHILQTNESCLIILNTIEDTKNLYNNLFEEVENVLLLNTHFIPDDRLDIINKAKQLLSVNERVILISTQLIEAGVDIDFPVVYRDLCPLPSLIQSAGRCNRNKKRQVGLVYFFQLTKNGKSRANLIYRNEAKVFLEFCKKEITDRTSENALFDIQSNFFEYIKDNLSIGDFFIDKDHQENMIECINNAKFETLGQFKLISSEIGVQVQYYILKDESDTIYEKLEELLIHLSKCISFDESRLVKISINSLVKSLNGRVLNVRLNRYNKHLFPDVYYADVMGIKFISNENYSNKLGLLIDNSENCFL